MYEQRAQVLRQQQQRLLLLRHSSKCPAGTPQNPEKCRATPHCAQMKQLWQHIAKCKDQRCATSHCVSSRYVLSHYHRCKDQSCMVCGPVRQAIQRHVVKSGGQGGKGGKGGEGGKGGSSGGLRARWAPKKTQQAKPTKKTAAFLPPPVDNTNEGQSRKRARVVASDSNSGSDDDTLSDSSGPPQTKVKVEMVDGFSIMSAASDLEHTAGGLARQGAPTS